MAGAGFQVAFEFFGEWLILEGDICFSFPGRVSLAISAVTSIVFKQPLLDILGAANVEAFRVIAAAKDIDVVHRCALLRPTSLSYALRASEQLRSGFAAASSSLDHHDT